jgi:hypothetical protein
MQNEEKHLLPDSREIPERKRVSKKAVIQNKVKDLFPDSQEIS